MHNTVSSKTTSKSTSKVGNLNYENHVAAYSNNSSITTVPTSLQYDSNNSGMRKSPEGKDNDSIRLEDNKLSRDTLQKYHDTNTKLIDQQKYRDNSGNQQKIGNDISTEIFSASNDNGKINVQVTVLVGEF